ncbi:MAG: type IV pilus modification protein PilV [Thermomonas sp.]
MKVVRMRSPASTRRYQRGVGLIEVLVSVLVMAIGMLGLAALQSLSMRNSQSSLDRTQAVYQIYSILDAMRANSNSLAAYKLDMQATPCNAPAAGATLASKDLNSWITQLQAGQGGLGANACGSIAIDAGNPRLVTVTVRWDDSRGGTAGAQGSTAQATTLVTQL